MEVSTAKRIMGKNFIGMEELRSISGKFRLDLSIDVPEIEHDEAFLMARQGEGLLVLCVPYFMSGEHVTIRNIRRVMKERNEEPCFYNQDWFLNEGFIDEGLTCKWILVSKGLLAESRGCEPDEINRSYTLFKAVELTYVFFVNYFVTGGERLWNNDYVWCSDCDDKGDQIYVGRYTDVSGLNSDGFEIHRHLKVKQNYGAV